jgi:radical SAM protein with 4Fe4S-binding SPASM domain
MGTNGVFSPDTLAKALDSGIDWFIISMDREHEAESRALSDRGCYTAAETAGALVQAGRRIRVNTLIQRDNYTFEQLEPLAARCVDLGVESLNCIPLRPYVQDPSALKQQLTREEFRVFIADLMRLRMKYPALDLITTLDLRHTASLDRVYQKDRSCAAGREGCVISPFGEIYGCSYSLASSLKKDEPGREKFVAGDLREREFMDIWNDSDRWAVYRDLASYKNKKCHNCTWYQQHRCIGNCPIMVRDAPEAFDPYCYVELDDHEHL